MFHIQFYCYLFHVIFLYFNVLFWVLNLLFQFLQEKVGPMQLLLTLRTLMSTTVEILCFFGTCISGC